MLSTLLLLICEKLRRLDAATVDASEIPRSPTWDTLLIMRETTYQNRAGFLPSTVCLYLLDLKLNGSSWKFDDGLWQNSGVSNTQFMNTHKHLKESFVHSHQLKKKNIENETNSTNQKNLLGVANSLCFFSVFPPPPPLVQENTLSVWYFSPQEPRRTFLLAERLSKRPVSVDIIPCRVIGFFKVTFFGQVISIMVF